MSYIVNKTSGQALVTILDGTTDTSTGVVLIGRNYTNYGEVQNENFVRLMESFAGTAPPDQTVAQYALSGQLWYNTTTHVLNIYNGSTWMPVSGSAVAAVAPYWSSIPVGFQWWDTVNQQLFVYNGTTWILVGPSSSALYGKSGAVVELIYDTSGTSHVVTKMYSQNNVMAIFSNETFTSNVNIVGFPNGLSKGITLATNAIVNGTATNAQQLDNVAASNYIRSDVSVGLQHDLSVAGVIGTNGAYVEVESTYNSFQLQNTNLNGGTDFYNNVNGTITNTLHIDGNTGLLTVSNDPINDLGIATKQYVDTMSVTVAGMVSQENTSLYANLQLFQVDIDANLNILYNEYQGMVGNVASLQYVTQHVLAPLDSPTFIGTAQAPIVPEWTGNSQIATTYYVDRQDNEIIANLSAGLNALKSNLEARLTADENTFAPNASPQFSGVPTAPSPSYPATPSDRIATTSYVSASQEVWSGRDANNNYVNSKRFISTSPPNNSLGNDGDFWFQIVP